MRDDDDDARPAPERDAGLRLYELLAAAPPGKTPARRWHDELHAPISRAGHTPGNFRAIGNATMPQSIFPLSMRRRMARRKHFHAIDKQADSHNGLY